MIQQDYVNRRSQDCALSHKIISFTYLTYFLHDNTSNKGYFQLKERNNFNGIPIK